MTSYDQVQIENAAGEDGNTPQNHNGKHLPGATVLDGCQRYLSASRYEAAHIPFSKDGYRGSNRNQNAEMQVKV